MVQYEYKMVQVPRDLAARIGDVDKGAGAVYMQKAVDEGVAGGWEFYRVDTLTITEKPGCLQSLLGQKEVLHALNIICFRREKNAG